MNSKQYTRLTLYPNKLRKHASFLQWPTRPLCLLQSQKNWMKSYRDWLSACMWAVHSSIKPRLSSSLAYQPSPVEGYSITSCNSNNHFHSHALPLSHCFLCFFHCLSLSLQSSSGNWEWAIKRSQTCAAWETRGRAIYCPLIYYKPSLSPLLCGVGVCVACVCVCVSVWQRSDCEFVVLLSSIST